MSDRLKRWPCLLLCAATIACTHTIGNVGDVANKRPNFVIIVIDDMGWSDSTLNAPSFYETPSIQRLADEGMNFSQAYGASPLCSPTRASIATGRNPARLHLTTAITKKTQYIDPKNGRQRPWLRMFASDSRTELPLDEVTIAEAMKEAGYRTGFIGKWHLGAEAYWPEYQGFDVNIAGGHYAAPPSYFSPYKIKNLEDGPRREYITDRLTREAEAYIEQNRDEPFLLFFWHYAVHGPLDAKQEDIEVYKGREPHVNGQGNPVYAGMIRSTDQSVGRILDKLDALALSENTVVVFISDNGGLTRKRGKMGKSGKVRKGGSEAGTRITTNEPLRGGKAMIYEGGIRVPMAVRWPGTIKAGSNSHVPVITDDFYPTILSLAGVKPRAGLELDGRDISPLFMGGKELDRDFLVWHFPHYINGFRPDKGKETFWNTPSSAIREGDWKLIEFYGRGVELYNLAKDIGERKDVAAEHPDRVKRMRAAMAKWLDDREAWIPQPNPEFDEEHPKSKSQSMRDERES